MNLETQAAGVSQCKRWVKVINMAEFNGVQQNPKLGANFDVQYGVNSGDNNLTNQTTLQNNPLYNLSKVIFQGELFNNINRNFGDVGAISTNGLRNNPPEDGDEHKLFTSA